MAFVALWATLLGALAATGVISSLLPAKYYNDGLVIYEIVQGHLTAHSQSYLATAFVYRTLGIGAFSQAAILGICMVGVFVWLAILRAPISVLPALTVLGCFLMVPAAVYLGQYSKETWVLAMLLAVTLFHNHMRYWICFVISLAAMALYAILVREYWGIVLSIWILLLVLPRRLGVILHMLYVLAIFFLLVIAFEVIYETPLAAVREHLNAGRLVSSDARSLISDLIMGDSIIVTFFNLTLNFIRLLFPIELIVGRTKLVWIAAAALVMLMTTLFVWVWWRSMSAHAPRACHSLSSLCLAFFMVQALFEPDFGTALRHKLPFFFVVLGLFAELSRLRTRCCDLFGGVSG